MSDLKREVWIAEWHDTHGKGSLSGYAFDSEDAAKSHIAQQLAEDDIRAKNGRARAWEGATWTTSRFVPAEPEQAGKAEGWVSVKVRPLEPGETRVMAVEIRRNGTPDWDVFVATPCDSEEDEWTSESNDPGWAPSEVGYSMSIEGLPALPTKEPTNG